MQPFSWSPTELLQSRVADHFKTQRRYSLDNQNFDYHSPLEVFWILNERKGLIEGATYYAADYALVIPECFDQIDEFLAGLEMRFFEKFEHATQVYFKDVDARAKTMLQRAVEGWIEEYVYVEHQWCMVGKAESLTVSEDDLPGSGQQNPASDLIVGKPIPVRRLQGLRNKMGPALSRKQLQNRPYRGRA